MDTSSFNLLNHILSAGILCTWALPSWSAEELVVYASATDPFEFTSIDPSTKAATSNMTDILLAQPGVSRAGQGGLLQGSTLRGLSRQRLAWQIEDIPIVTERRAGSTLSFLAAPFVTSVDTLSPAQSYAHSNQGLGGAITAHLGNTHQKSASRIGWVSSGQQGALSSTLHNERLDAGIAYRDANNTRTANDQRLNSAFRQTSGFFKVRGDWPRGTQSELFVLSANDTDIGKSNTDYPARRTEYPYDRHHMAQVSVTQEHWRGFTYAYNSNLKTEVREQGTLQSNDLNSQNRGIGVEGTIPLEHATIYPYLSVHSRDSQSKEIASLSVSHTTLRADELTTYAGIRGTASVELWRLSAHTGMVQRRYSSAQTHSESDFITSISAARTINRYNYALELARNIRYPTLSELYYCGITGRGDVIGNANLQAEIGQSITARWSHASRAFSAEAFVTHIDRAIERIDLANDVSTYVNFGTVKVLGLRWMAQKKIQDHWLLGAQAQFSRVRKSGEPTNNQAANEITLFAQRTTVRANISVIYTYRAKNTDISESDVPLDAAHILDLTWEANTAGRWQFAVGLYNALDESYQLATDRKATTSIGRHVKASIGYHVR